MAHDGIYYTTTDDNASVEQHLLNDFQHNFPLSPTPYADMAKQLGISEERVLQILQAKTEEGVISRVGAVFAPNKVGASTLAAMAVPEAELLQVAEQISSCDSINHNYQREHEYNLWFVITAASKEALAEEIKNIESKTGYEILNLPMLEDYHIDLGFDIKWT